MGSSSEGREKSLLTEAAVFETVDCSWWYRLASLGNEFPCAELFEMVNRFLSEVSLESELAGMLLLA